MLAVLIGLFLGVGIQPAAADPTLTTVASASVPVGGTITDSATLANGVSPTGTVSFSVFGPNNATCAGSPIFTSTQTVNGNGNYTSSPFATSAPGIYQFRAAYSGDDTNLGVSSPCGAESVVVTNATSITTNATATITSFSDTATLNGAVSPTGTITFNVFGPNDPTCSAATPAFTSTSDVSQGPLTSSSFLPPQAPGRYRFVVTYSGDASNAGAVSPCNAPNESVLFGPTVPTLVTAASSVGRLGSGGTISDSATLSGADTPTGTITFTVFGPNNAACTGTAAFTSTATVTSDGSYPSGNFTPTAAGTYHFVATYSGDATNSAVTTACTDAGETVTVRANPAIATAPASTPVAYGSSVSDNATLSEGLNPTGTLTFYVAPDPNCGIESPTVATSTVTVNGNGTYNSGDFATVPNIPPGTYHFFVFYNGDLNNNSVSAFSCSAETFVVTKAPVSLTTNATATVTNMSDTATLNGAVSPTGTVTFNAYGPNDPTCSAASPTLTRTVPVAAQGPTSSGFSAPNAPGRYRFVVTYSGDANNSPAASACNAPNEAVGQAASALTTTASANVPVGGNISDTATLSGGDSPTGIINFSVYGPDNAACTGSAAFTSTASVTGNGSYPSGNFTPTTPGVYRFVASYSGDTNNGAAATTCNDANESVVVQFSPTIVTQATSPVPVGGSASDIAVLSGAGAPTGTIKFTLFNNCSEAPQIVFASTKTVTGNGSYTSDPYTVTAPPGTYFWFVSYSGDVNNGPAFGGCGATNETLVVTQAGPTIITQASGPVTAGGSLSDTATLSGGVSPTGTIAFRLFGPGDATCAATPLFTSMVSVNGNGTYPSGPYTAITAGTYQWVASYSGDANNGAATAACNAAGESVVVSPPQTTTTTTTTVPQTTTTRPPTTTTTTTTTTRPPTTVPSTTTIGPPTTAAPGVSTTRLPPPTTPRTTPRTTPPRTTHRTLLVVTKTTQPPPPTTQPPPPKTTQPPPPTTQPPPPTTQPPPPTTQPAPTLPGPTPLIAVTPDGVPTGRAGVGLSVRGSGYRDCKTVYFFVGTSRVGSGAPDGSGNIRIDNLSIPGDTSVGLHRVSSSCLSSGKSIRQSTTFTVTHSRVHRSAFMTTIPRPDQISLNAKRASVHLLIALLIIPLVAFPSELFNSTLEENYNEVRGWFGLPPRKDDANNERRQYVLFAVMLVVSGVVYSAVSPDFGFNRSTFVLAVGLGLAVIITGIGFALPSVIYMRRRVGEWGRLKVLPGTIVVGIATVGISRLLHLQPGYIYGLLAVFVFRRTIDETHEGRLASGTSLILLLLSLAAWLALVPISAAAAKPHSGLVILIIEACLGGVFLIGLESLLVDLLPMRFLDGSTELKWSKSAWAALFGFGVFALIQVLLTPSSGYVGHTSSYSLLLVIIAYVAFGLFSFSFWGYFRYRRPPPGDESAEPRGSEPDWMVQG